MRKVISVLLTIMMLCTALVFPIEAQASGTQAPDIQAESAILIDAATGQILYQKNMNQKAYPASITKILTGMVALEKGDLSQKIIMSEEAVFSIDRASAHIALDVDEEITLEQALFALSIASANEAANGIAESIGGDVASYADLMNKTAAEAGAQNTNFTNPNGLHDDNHYTTAYDMARITAAALKLPRFVEIFGTEKYDIPPTNKQPETRMMWSRNRFINGGFPYEGILMSKTGWTQEAQHTLVTAAKRGERTFVAVIMKSARSSDIWKDTAALFDYGFNAFTPVKISKEHLAKLAPTEITADNDAIINAVFSTPADVTLLIPTGKTMDDLTVTYGQPQIDSDKNQAQLVACVSLNNADNAQFVDVDVNMIAQIELPQGSGRTDSSNLQAAFGKILLGLLLTIAVGGVILFLLAQKQSRRRRRAKERQAREMRARKRQQASRNPYLSSNGQISRNRYSNY